MAPRWSSFVCIAVAAVSLEVRAAQEATECAAGACQAEEPEEVGLLQVPPSKVAVPLWRTGNESELVQTSSESNSSFFSNCVYQSFPGKDAKKHITLGTTSNMDSKLATLGIDLTGLWWMKGNPVAEVLASFAGTKVNSSTYPAELMVPNSLANSWSWRNGAQGTTLMKFYSLQTLGYTPEGTMGIIMNNASDGHVDTALKENPAVLVEAWGFEKLNEDQWNRTTSFQNRSIFDKISGDHWYTLTRILKADGEPTKFWNEYLKSQDGRSTQQTFITNDACLRSCRVAIPSCTVCKFFCRK